jgi:hypothetical protein
MNMVMFLEADFEDKKAKERRNLSLKHTLIIATMH